MKYIEIPGLPDTLSICDLPDTLSICDDEIKAMFKDKAYDVSLPIQAQLIKELRLLREAIENGPSYRD